MKNLVSSLVFLSIVSVVSAQSLKTSILAIQKPIEHSLKTKNIPEFTKIMHAFGTKDFKYTERGHTMSMDKMIEGMKGGLGTMQQLTKVESKIISVKEKGTTGVATMMHVIEGIMIGPDKKPHKMVFSGFTTEGYRKVGGKWKQASMTWTSQNASMDGKVMPSR